MQQEKFKQMSADLMALKESEFLAHNFNKNPIAQAHQQFNQKQITFFIQQWALIANRYITNLIQMEKTISPNGWEIVATIIQEIITDELSHHTQKTTHYETLGINFHNITASRATSVLFNNMDTAFCKEVSYIVGTLYATEAKAIEELLMLRKIILSLSKGNLSSTMHVFLDEPINKWKITHLEGLNSSIYKYLSPEDYGLFRLGFTDMILGLNAWWMNITTETLAQRETVEA